MVRRPDAPWRPLIRLPFPYPPKKPRRGPVNALESLIALKPDFGACVRLGVGVVFMPRLPLSEKKKKKKKKVRIVDLFLKGGGGSIFPVQGYRGFQGVDWAVTGPVRAISGRGLADGQSGGMRGQNGGNGETCGGRNRGLGNLGMVAPETQKPRHGARQSLRAI